MDAAEGFAAFLADDETFRTGAFPRVWGRAAVAAFVAQFWTTVESSRPSDRRAYEADDALFLEGALPPST